MVRLAVVGVGRIGGEVAFLATALGLVDELVLYDTARNLLRAQVLDIRHTGLPVTITTGIRDIRDADICVFAAGQSPDPLGEDPGRSSCGKPSRDPEMRPAALRISRPSYHGDKPCGREQFSPAPPHGHSPGTVHRVRRPAGQCAVHLGPPEAGPGRHGVCPWRTRGVPGAGLFPAPRRLRSAGAKRSSTNSKV